MTFIERIRAWRVTVNNYKEHRKVFPGATDQECEVALGRAKALGLTPKQWAEKAKRYQDNG